MSKCLPSALQLFLSDDKAISVNITPFPHNFQHQKPSLLSWVPHSLSTDPKIKAMNHNHCWAILIFWAVGGGGIFECPKFSFNFSTSILHCITKLYTKFFWSILELKLDREKWGEEAYNCRKTANKKDICYHKNNIIIPYLDSGILLWILSNQEYNIFYMNLSFFTNFHCL